jgi:ferredoxin
LLFSKGICGACIKRCPVNAISKDGHDKVKCFQVYGEESSKLVQSYGAVQRQVQDVDYVKQEYLAKAKILQEMGIFFVKEFLYIIKDYQNIEKRITKLLIWCYNIQ